MNECVKDHWSKHAGQWQHVGQPLRPGPEDVATAARMIRQVQPRPGKSMNAVLLGVTPELVSLPWPESTRLLAVDRSPGMLCDVLPMAGRSTASGLCGNWLQLPLADASVDCVIGDGCLTVLETVDAYRKLAAGVRRVLRPGGSFVIRLFVRPARAEPPAGVIADLLAGRIGNFHVFKWRLAMALHPDLDSGIRVHEVWRYWNEAGIEAAALSQRLGWPVAQIETIDAYRDAQARYTFPTLDEARALLADDFSELHCELPGYELGERCPTLLLASRP